MPQQVVDIMRFICWSSVMLVTAGTLLIRKYGAAISIYNNGNL